MDITVYCRPASMINEVDDTSSGSGMILEELRASCNGGDDLCLNDLYRGSIRVGPPQAGDRYLCAMIASIDNNLDDFRNLSDIIPQTGK